MVQFFSWVGCRKAIWFFCSCLYCKEMFLFSSNNSTTESSAAASFPGSEIYLRGRNLGPVSDKIKPSFVWSVIWRRWWVLKEVLSGRHTALGSSMAKGQDACRHLSSTKATKSLSARPIAPLPPLTPLKQNLMAFTALEVFVCMLRGIPSLSPWAVVQSIWRMQDLEIPSILE